jgi:hypothetical protein
VVEIPRKVAGCAGGHGVPFGRLRAGSRLRKTIRFASRLAPLRMTGFGAEAFFLLLLAFTANSSATTYYVSSSAGSDSNSGTSAAAAWQTIAHVNGQTFLPGDSILFKRGDVWNESLATASSGSSGNPIAYDAYGTGAPPNLTGYYAVPTTAWVLVTGNAWKAAVPATYTTINFCLFGSIWGQKVAAVSSNLTAQWDFYLANGFIYVYSQGNPATYYNESIVPMALSNVPVISINGQSWLTFQHLLVNWFDQYGVYVQGTSDHLVFANMEADSMIPQGTQPLGFYVDESAPGPGDIKIYNAEAHLNYDGFRVDGSATGITMVNDKAYANRDGALVDNTGAVTYSHCHFYASSLAVAGSTDVEWTSGSGPIAGAGNIPPDTAPAVQVYQRYPAEVTLTVDDAGMTPGADTYYASTVLPVADAAGVPVGAAITVGYPLAQTLVSEFQGWVNAGRDVTSHSISHTYYTNTDALDIQYTGSGTAAALSIGSKTLTITVTGAADSVSYNLAQGQTQGTILGLQQALAATGKFTTSYFTPCQGPYGTGCSAYTAQGLLAQDLADISGQDVKSAVYHMQLNVTRLTTDEITLSRQWMTTNLTGLPATPVYVYPGGYETTAMQGITEGVPYGGARGALKEDLGVKDTYADGFNVQNITSFGVNPSWMGLQPSVLNQKIQALVWKESVWGVPWGIFWHLNELTNSDPVGGTEITNLIQDFKASGVTIQTNTSLVNWLLSGTQEIGTDGDYYYAFPATSMTLDFRPTKSSPVVDAGQNLGSAYALDINGVNQNSYGSGWEIGAHVYEGYSAYGLNQAGSYFTVGLGTAGGCGPPQFNCANTSDAAVDVVQAPNLGGVTSNNALVTDTMVANASMFRVTDGTTQTGANANFEYSVPCGGSADNNIASLLDNLFLVADSGNNHFIRYLNPSGNNSLPLYPNLDAAKGNLIVHCGEFSYTNDQLFYDHGVINTGTTMTQYNLAGYNSPGIANPSALPIQTVVADFSNVLSGAPTWHTIGGMNRLDNVNSLSFILAEGYSTTGGQGTGCIAGEAITNAVAPVLANVEYYAYNTCTGVVTTQVGSGAPTTVGTVAMDDRFCIHNFKYHGGAYATITAATSVGSGCTSVVTGNGAGYYFWQLGTATVIPCVVCGGHETEYESSFIGALNGDGDGLNFGRTTYSTTGAGVVNTSGTSMTFVGSGIAPNSSMTGKIAINGVAYPISSCTFSGCTLTTSAGTQTGVRYYYPVNAAINGGFYGMPQLISFPTLWAQAGGCTGSFPFSDEPCAIGLLDSHLNSNTNPGNDTGMVFYSTTTVGATNFPRSMGIVSTIGSTVNLLYGGPFASSWSGHNIIINGGNYAITAFNSSTQVTVSPSPGTLTGVNYYFTLYPGATYDEVDGVVGGGPTPAAGYNYRFAHTYNTTLNPNFSTNSAITSCTQDGKYCFISTDWQCSLGTTNGSNTSYCAPDWPASTTVAANALLWPESGNNGGYVYRTSASCTTGSTEPSPWTQTAGGTQTDGGCSWSNIGTYRGDVMVLSLSASGPTQSISPPVTIMGPYPPQIAPAGGCPSGTGGSPQYCNYQISVLPNIKGTVFGVTWAQGNVISGTDVGVESNSTPGQYNWTGFDAMVNGYAEQTCGANLASGGAPCLVSFAMGMAENHGLLNSGNGNTFTPQYIYGQSWSNNVAPTWATGTTYLAKQDVMYGGTYYQNNGTNGSCISSGSGGPASDTGCPWTSTGSNAAVQDATFGTEYLVGSNSNWPTLGSVANLNSATCVGGTAACTAAIVAQGAPVTFETPVFAAWKNFLTAFFQHIAAAPYASQVRYVRTGIGQASGESYPWDASLLQPLSGGTQTTLGNTWLAFHASYVNDLEAARNMNFPAAGLNITSNGCLPAVPCSWADQEAADGAAIGAGPGSESLQVADVTAYAGGTNCSNDWCLVFTLYGPTAPFVELQELEASSTTGRPGMLNQFVPFGVEMRGNAPLYLEIVAADLECSFVSGYSGSNCPGTGLYAPFAAALQSAAVGVPGPR